MISDASLLEAVVGARDLVVLAYGPDLRAERSIGARAAALACRSDVADLVARAATGIDVTADVCLDGAILELSVRRTPEGVVLVGRDRTSDRIASRRLAARAAHAASLAELGQRTAEAGEDLCAVLTAIVETAAGELAPSATVRLLDQSGRWGVGADHHVEPDARPLQAAVLRATPEPKRGVVAQSLAAHAPHFGCGIELDRVRELVDPSLWPLAERWPSRSMASIPLESRGRQLGVLILGRHDDRSWTEDDRSWALEIADRAALAIDNAQLLTGLARRVDRQAALAQLGRDALSGMPLRELSDEVARVVTKALDVEVAGLTLGQPGDESLLIIGGAGWAPSVVGASHVPAGPGSLSYTALLTGEPAVVEDFLEPGALQPSEAVTAQGLRSGAVVVIAHEHRYGTLGAFHATPRRWTDEDVNFLQSAAHVVAGAIARDVADDARARASETERLAELGQLAAGIAHDVNNIVAVVGVYAELLESQLGLDEDGRHQVAAIREQTKHAVGLVWQVLDVAHRSTVTLRELEPTTFVNDMARLVSDTAPAGVKVVTRVEPDTPPVMADAGALHQVLLNLACNAVDAMPNGGELTLRAGPGDDGGIVLAVQDTGAGMPADVRARAFEPFFTTKPSGKGTGLGLTQAAGIVTQHHGRLEIDSVPGEGSTVSIWLPAA